MLGSGNRNDPALKTLAALGEREVLPEAGDMRGDVLGGKEVAEAEIEAELRVLRSHLGGAGDRETCDGEEWKGKGKEKVKSESGKNGEEERVLWTTGTTT